LKKIKRTHLFTSDILQEHTHRLVPRLSQQDAKVPLEDGKTLAEFRTIPEK
jgi:hypothetical protein